MTWRSSKIKKAASKRRKKTMGIYNPKHRPKAAGNKIKFEMGTKVTVHGRSGTIVDSYLFQGVIFYRLKWKEHRLTWYDKHIGQEASEYGWSQSKFIRRE